MLLSCASLTLVENIDSGVRPHLDTNRGVRITENDAWHDVGTNMDIFFSSLAD